MGFTGAVATAQAVSYLLWAAVALLWRDIPKRSRIQAGVLIALGVVMLVVAQTVYGAVVNWPAMLQGNVFVASMLVGVSFISLIGTQGNKRAPGKRVTGGGRRAAYLAGGTFSWHDFESFHGIHGGRPLGTARAIDHAAAIGAEPRAF